MKALSDTLLAGGCASHIEAIHGETITVLSGPDQGRTFTAVNESEPDNILTTDLGEDRRGKRILRFRDGQVPNITSQNQIQTADGKKYYATRAPQDGFLTTDFELSEIAPNIDT